MEENTFLELSGVMGLSAAGVLTVNLLLGMLLSTPYRKMPLWKKLPPQLRQVDILTLHNYTAYVGLGAALLHPLLLLSANTKFQWADLVWPANAPHQPLFATLGALSWYALLLVVLTSFGAMRRRLPFRLWKTIHFVAYAVGLLFLVHGLVMDPLLKDRPVDWLDAEKAFVELCTLLIVIGVGLRIRYQLSSR